MKEKRKQLSQRVLSIVHRFPVNGRYPVFGLFISMLMISIMALFFAGGTPVWWRYTPENLAFVKTQTAAVYELDNKKIERVFQRLEILKDLTLSHFEANNTVKSSRTILPTSTLNGVDPEAIELGIKYAGFVIEKLMRGGYMESPETAVRGDAPYIYIETKGRPGILAKSRTPISNLVAKTDIQSEVASLANEVPNLPVGFVVNLVSSLIEGNLEFRYLDKDIVTSFSQKITFYDIAIIFVYMVLICLIFFYGMLQYGTKVRMKILSKRYYLALALLVIFLGISFAIFSHLNIEGFLQIVMLPVTLYSSLMVLLYGHRLAMRFIFLFCTVLFMICRFDPPACLYIVLISGSTLFIMHFASTRLRLFACSVGLGIVCVVIFQCIMLIFPLFAMNNPMTNVFVFSSGVFSVIGTVGILPLFEFFVRIPTRYSLLELANLNATLLRKLQGVAPGTYNHSLNLATLAENACLAIGANGLLARVAAYYHDIGKMENPQYFIENQVGFNPHDDLSPEVSARIICDHVKHGLDLGASIRLPAEILQIINEHHGQSLVVYFYEKAMKSHHEAGSPLPEKKDFMYTGQWPQTSESAIVALADTVEAVSHTIKDPSIAKLHEVVQEIVMNKIREGIFSHCSLTMDEIHKIAEDMVHTLSGQYHARIIYPESKNG
ncbi:MAG: HDIG domain-containing metalloprotein [Spirochaetia bacterium]